MKLIDIFEMSEEAIDDTSREIKRMFSPLGININFSKHFGDRIVDDAVDEKGTKRDNITVTELLDTFKSLKDHYKDIFGAAHNFDDEVKRGEFQGVILDVVRKINVPFVLEFDKSKGRFILTCKTIMKKENFQAKSSDHIFPIRGKK